MTAPGAQAVCVEFAPTTVYIHRTHAHTARNRLQHPSAILLWRNGVRLGLIPHYMFIERDTGARNYFEVTLVRAYEIFRDAYSSVSGLARSVRDASWVRTPFFAAFDPGAVWFDQLRPAFGSQSFHFESEGDSDRNFPLYSLTESLLN